MAELKTKLLRDEEVLDVKVDYEFFGSGYKPNIMQVFPGYLFVTNMRIIFEPSGWGTTLEHGFNLHHSTIKEFGTTGHGMTFVTMDADKYKLVGIKNSKKIGNYLKTNFYNEGAREIERKRIKAKNIEKKAVKISDYKKAISIWEDLGEEYEVECIEKIIEEKIGKAKDKERLLDFDSAIIIYQDLGLDEDVIRLRTKLADEKRVKVDQTVVHGDQVTKTEIKDSVVSKSNVGGGSSKMQELEKLAEMKKEGLIDDDEFKQMKKEILGK